MSSARSSLSAGGHSARAIALLAYRPPGWIIPDVPLFSPSPRLPSPLPAPSLLRYLTASLPVSDNEVRGSRRQR